MRPVKPILFLLYYFYSLYVLLYFHFHFIFILLLFHFCFHIIFILFFEFGCCRIFSNFSYFILLLSLFPLVWLVGLLLFIKVFWIWTISCFKTTIPGWVGGWAVIIKLISAQLIWLPPVAAWLGWAELGNISVSYTTFMF